jgi:osmoprotectant transport system permease protein
MHEVLAELPRLLVAHLELSLLSLLLGALISLPLGVLASRSLALERLVMGLASVLQTIPSLALLALMVPALGALGLRNIGFLPAFMALVLYSIFPILQGTVVGLSGVEPAVLEAARAVGMSERQKLWRVELPLASPNIFAGLRTACVWTVGAATLATPVGADSLGNFIFGGLQTRNLAAISVGCAASAALALALDGSFRLLSRLAEPRRRAGRRAGLALAGALLTLLGGAVLVRGVHSERRGVTIGAKTFAEQYILSEALALQIERVTGVAAATQSSLGSALAFDALQSGSIDAYVDYAGTIWTTIMKRRTSNLPRAEMRAKIDEFLMSRYGIRVLAALGFENTYALAVPRSRSRELGITSISQLSRVSGSLSIAGDYEFFARPEWQSLSRRYGLHFAEQRAMNAALMYQAIGSGAVDVIAGFSTDGRIAGGDLLVLVDDQGVIPPYDALLLGSPRLLARHPDVVDCLRALGGRISAAQMRHLNQEVSEGRASPRETAVELVRSWHQLSRADVTR